MTPPEDKAPDMPSEIWLYYDNHPDELRVKWADFDAGSSMYPATKYTRTIQSPDQGAVEAWKRVNATLETHETYEDMNIIYEALTRPPLDLEKLKRDTWKDWTGSPDEFESPDQGAVEKLDLLQKRAYSHAEKSNSPKLMREWIDSDVEVIRQALTRPPLDLAGLKRVSTGCKCGDAICAAETCAYDTGWNKCLDHLQAIRPDLFGGKENHEFDMEEALNKAERLRD